MTARGRRTPPQGRRATIIAVVLSLLIPGLGHAYLGYLGRALIWFGGTIALAVVMGQSAEEQRMLALVMGAIIGVFAAVDILVLRRAR